MHFHVGEVAKLNLHSPQEVHQKPNDFTTSNLTLAGLIPHDFKTPTEFFKNINPFGTILHIVEESREHQDKSRFICIRCCYSPK